MLDSFARFIHARAKIVLSVALIAAVLAGILGAGVASRLLPYGANDPATQSVKVTNRYEAATGHQIAPGVVALVTPQTPGGIRTAAAHRVVDGVVAELRRSPAVALVAGYYETHNPALVSRDGRSTYVVAYFRAIGDGRIADASQVIENEFAGRSDVVLGGDGVANKQVNKQVSGDLGHAELLAFPIIVLLSLLFFRSGVAALLPPALGGLAIVFTFLALRVASGFFDLSVFALNLVTGLGLGLSIDYSLFIVSRYREESARGGAYDAGALVRTLKTAGRTVMFSSLTVAAAVASLMIFPQRFLFSMGVGGVMVALIAATLALVVLPATLALLGERVNALSPAFLRRAAEHDARPATSGPWYRISRFVARRPARVAVTSAAVLIALGIPFTGIKFTTVSANVLPPSASARHVSDALNRDFPRNRTSPLQVLVDAPAGSPTTSALATQMRALPDVAGVAPPQPAGAHMALISVAPASDPLSPAALDLVGRVRALHSPSSFGVAGDSASYVDLRHSLSTHIPLVLLIVIGATVIVLYLFTGSVILPVKAVVMNALTLSAVFGILVLVFQDGNLQGLLGYTSLGAVDTTQPILLFVIAFGLATDYGVFLLSRIKEAHDAGIENSQAVAIGLERTGRIVTAAALLLAVALGAFATSQIVFIKELGLGSALAVLIDASIVRALLVPSLMELLGSANWWAPATLRRAYARFGLSEAT